MQEYLYIVLYKLVLESIFCSVFLQKYEYAKYYLNLDYLKLIFSYVIVVIFFRLVIKYKLSLHFIFLIFILIPLSSLYALMNLSTYYILMNFLSYLITIIISKNYSKSSLVFNAQKEEVYLKILFYIIIILWVLFLLKYGMFDLRALNIYDVYSIRKERVYTKVWSYILSWLTTSLIPFVLLLALKLKKYIIVLIATILQIYFYMYSGRKFYFFIIFFLIFSYFSLKREKKIYIKWCQLFIFLMILSQLEYIFFKTTKILSVFPGRTLIEPARISYLHYYFFSKFENLYYSETIIGKILNINLIYDKYSGYLISEYFLQGAGNYGNSNANTGFIGSAYGNLGLIGILIESIILGLIMRMFYKFASSRIKRVILPLGYIFVILLSSGPLSLVLLTGGTLLNLILIYLYIKLTKQD